MINRNRLVGSIAATALLGAGLLSAAAPATAAPAQVQALNCGPATPLTGSGGHKGARVTCTGAAFTASVVCDKQGYQYRHFGNRAVSGGTSTVWCDLGAYVVKVQVEAT
ncbi:hypothetical protein OG204_01645 [Streptomyces sp. NBC_01387]|uniref:hypothetical protein n=1 Tax=unclassified Streptomyces TaxID=2593676 RepID=UPI0020248946|nr:MULTISPECIES: hypothetical protein [unclassified Streptomyces]WSC24330.1 hypothetical protein OIE60_34195 [Streptomyces sp. NBC_01766]WSV58214.1 hypothetical protein OG282_33480 [Streptomyces sp. NBC_01014]